jgi:hypothetical protein
LSGYESPNTRTTSIPDDAEAIRALEIARSQEEKDHETHKVISWATRKDYEIHVGISLGIRDPET